MRKKMVGKVAILLLCLMLSVSFVLAGCANNNNNDNDNQNSNDNNKQTDDKNEKSNDKDNNDKDNNDKDKDSSDEDIEVEESGFRKLTEDKITFTVWAPFSSTLITDMDENVAFQKIQEVTNIDLDFKHPPAGEENQNFNLMIASDQLTDLIFNPTNFPGGPDKAVEDGYYVKLNDYIDKYAPNYTRAMNSTDEIRRQCITDAGNIWAFSLIQLDKEPPWSGPIVRKDYLDKVGLDIPVTIDDWTEMLTAFRDELGVPAPLTMMYNWKYTSNSIFASAFDATLAKNNLDFFLKDGKEVAYGPIQPGFKDYLTLMNGWFEEGFIDSDFAIRDAKSFSALVSSGDAGAFIDGYGSISKMQASAVETQPDALFVAAPVPVVNEGDELHIRQSNPYVKPRYSVITEECENKEEAVKFLDLFYSDEGFYLFNYGIEGETYTLEDGAPGSDISFFPEQLREKHPVFTDFMMENPDGTDFWVLMDKYKSHTLSGMLRNPLSYQLSDEVMNAMDVWGATKDDWVMPSVVLTDEEAREFSTIMTEVETYQEEMMFKMIMSLEPLDQFDTYLKEIKNLGIERAIEIKATAYERYLNR